MAFQLLARGGAEITTVRLWLRSVDGEAQAWESVTFEPGTQLAAAAEIDLSQFPLSPFSPITFWWELADAAGSRVSTAEQTFQYEDNRFEWQTLSDGAIEVHWYVGDEAFGQAALSTATGSLPRINRDIRAPLPSHLDLYVYSSAADIQAALQRLGRTWADGHADPTLGVVLVVVPNDLRADFTLQREIPHELTHVLLYHATGSNLGRVPLWLNEGLAAMNQGQPETDFPALLEAARLADRFFSLADLCVAFPADATEARLAYAQSESVTRYLRSRFGSEGMHALVLAYASGAACEAGVQGATGLGLEELSAAWLRDVIYAGQGSGHWSNAAPWLLLTGLVLVAPLGFLLFGLRRVV
jgi:hypothetical protein